MKHSVKIGNWSIGLSVGSLFIMAIALIACANRDETVLLWTLAAIMIVWCFVALFYAPMAVSVDDSTLSIHRSLRIKELPLAEIESVKICQPTMAEKRICGSGGFMGYWVWFSERDLGKYFAYYGKASDCFLVTMKDGRKYMLGCQNPAEMVDAINARLRQLS